VLLPRTLYHGKVATRLQVAETLGSALDTKIKQAKAEALEAALFLKERARTSQRWPGRIGFSLGAYYALNLAAADPEQIRSGCALSTADEGTMGSDFSASRADYWVTLPSWNEYETQATVDSLEASTTARRPPGDVFRYPGTGHWFFEPDRVEALQPGRGKPGMGADALRFLKRSLRF